MPFTLAEDLRVTGALWQHAVVSNTLWGVCCLKLLLDMMVLMGPASVLLTTGYKCKRACFLLLMGAAASCLVSSRWEHSPKLAEPKDASLFNPSEVHQNHCFFACVCYCILHRAPKQHEVANLRQALADLWTLAPERLLQYTAQDLGLSSTQYLQQLRGSLWGGLPDLQLLLAAFNLGATIKHGELTFVVGNGAGPQLNFAEAHYKVNSTPAVGNWRKLSFLVRSRGGNLRRRLSDIAL
eukprot:4914137-Amphidinium_carterae.1